MKAFVIASILATSAAQAAAPVTKADLVCDFKRLTNEAGATHAVEPLHLAVDLTESTAVVTCAVDSDDCLTFDSTPYHITSVTAFETPSLALIRRGNGQFTSVSAGIDAMQLEGNDGDDTQVSISLRFAVDRVDGDMKLVANAVLTTSESDLIDEVSNIARCTVTSAR